MPLNTVLLMDINSHEGCLPQCLFFLTAKLSFPWGKRYILLIFNHDVAMNSMLFELTQLNLSYNRLYNKLSFMSGQGKGWSTLPVQSEYWSCNTSVLTSLALQNRVRPLLLPAFLLLLPQKTLYGITWSLQPFKPDLKQKHHNLFNKF